MSTGLEVFFPSFNPVEFQANSDVIFLPIAANDPAVVSFVIF